MRPIYIVLFALIGFVLYSSCKTTKYDLSDYKGERLIFGSGGGFTGLVKEYWILPNGQLFKGNGGELPIEQSKIKRRKAKRIFKKAEKINLINIQHKKPGNMYYYIRFEKEGNSSEVIWGREKNRLNESLDSLFNEFMLLLPKKKTTPIQ